MLLFVCPPADISNARVYRQEDVMFGNRILDSLEGRGLDALTPHLSRRTLGVGETVYKPFETFQDVLFPIDCVLSMITTMNDGDEIEVGTVGFEGFSCPEALLAAEQASSLVVSQVPGTALTMPFGIFMHALADNETLRTLAQHYARYFIALMSQCIACNRLHPLIERAARWLLTTRDRAKSDTFRLTQEYLSVLLGVHRQAVSVAASSLQQAGYIAYSRGTIEIKDARGLGSVSCECYDATSVALARLCPPL